MQRPITETLAALGHGTFIDEASNALNTLVTAVDETGRSGKLVMSLAIKKASRGSGAMIVVDEIRLTLPKQDARETMLFSTPEGNLIAEDPRQQQLELKTIPAAVTDSPAELKTLGSGEQQLKVVA